VYVTAVIFAYAFEHKFETECFV